MAAFTFSTRTAESKRGTVVLFADQYGPDHDPTPVVWVEQRTKRGELLELRLDEAEWIGEQLLDICRASKVSGSEATASEPD